jgi:hypothetical protein
MSLPFLSPWGQTGAIPSRLALFARRFAAGGLDRMSLDQQGLAMLVRSEVTRFAACHSQLQRRGNPPLARNSTPQVDDENFRSGAAVFSCSECCKECI